MAAFNRKTSLFIGVFKDEANTSQGYLIDSLDYEFDVTLSTQYMKSAATFTIYNPNQQTVNEIMNNGTGVIFQAGYDDPNGEPQVGTLFVGQVACVYTETEGPEAEKLIVICKSQRGAEYPLQRTFITAVIERGHSYYDVAKTIADYVGVPLSGAEVLKSRKLEDDYVINGNVRSEIENFMKRVLRSFGGSYILSNNEFIYIEPGNIARFSTVALNYNSGLISAKKHRDDRFQTTEDAFQSNMEYYIGLVNKFDDKVILQQAIEKVIPPKNEVEFECLINPQIHVGQPVDIDARINKDDLNAVNGKFYVTDIHITGDNFGNQFMMSCAAEEKVEMTEEQLRKVNELGARLKALEDKDS